MIMTSFLLKKKKKKKNNGIFRRMKEAYHLLQGNGLELYWKFEACD
jgi:hypothetical protein